MPMSRMNSTKKAQLYTCKDNKNKTKWIIRHLVIPEIVQLFGSIFVWKVEHILIIEFKKEQAYEHGSIF